MKNSSTEGWIIPEALSVFSDGERYAGSAGYIDAFLTLQARNDDWDFGVRLAVGGVGLTKAQASVVSSANCPGMVTEKAVFTGWLSHGANPSCQLLAPNLPATNEKRIKKVPVLRPDLPMAQTLPSASRQRAWCCPKAIFRHFWLPRASLRPLDLAKVWKTMPKIEYVNLS